MEKKMEASGLAGSKGKAS